MLHGEMEAVIGQIVATGGDADTIASIAGQVAGARLGLTGLPAKLVSMPCIAEVMPLATRFADFAAECALTDR